MRAAAAAPVAGRFLNARTIGWGELRVSPEGCS
jgi:hypothetical protein